MLVGHSTEDEPSIFTLAPQFDEGADWVRQGLWKTPPPAAAPQPLIATGSLSRQHTSGPGLEMQPGTFLQAAERSGATSGNGASEGASEEERLAGLTMIALTLEEQAPGLGLTAVNPSANPGICAGIPSTRSNFPEESAGRPRSSPPVQGSGFAESQQKSNPPGFLADSQGFAPPVPHNWLQLGRASHHTPATVGASHPVGVNRHYDNQPEPSSDQASAQPEPVPGPGMTQPEPIYGQRLAQPDPVSGHTVTQPEPVAGQGLTQPEPIVGQQPEQGVQRFAPVLASEKVGSIFGVSPAPVILPFKKRRWGVGSAGGGLTRASDRQPHTANIWEGDECKDERAARGGERKGSLQCEGKDGEGVRQAWAERSLASVPWQAYLARGAETGGEQETDWDGSEKEIGAASESEEYEESADFEDGAEYKLCGEHGMGFEEGWEGGSLGTGYRQGYESGYGESVACHGGFTNPSSAPSAQVGPRLEGCFWDGLAGNVWTSGYSSRGATQSGQFGDRARSGGLKGPGGETWSGGDGRVGMWSSARRSVQNTEKDEGVADSSMSEGFDERADNALRRHVGRWGIPQETRSWANAREAGSPEESFGTGHGSAHLSWGADVGMAGSPRHKKRLGSS